ncbi:hypothetical protein EV361DRAFT_874510, partial [Lentinula raphanica]
VRSPDRSTHSEPTSSIEFSPAPSDPQVQSPLPQNAVLNDQNTSLSGRPANTPVGLLTPPDSTLPTPTPSPDPNPGSRLRMQARDVDHACELLEIPKPHGSTGPGARSRKLSFLVQDWRHMHILVKGLGYVDNSEGGLSKQTYQWAGGRNETYESILKDCDWSKDDYKIKTKVYLWAREATKTKVWNQNFPTPENPVERRKFTTARDNWDRLCYFFNETTFHYRDHPDFSQPGTEEFKLQFLTQNVVKNIFKNDGKYQTETISFAQVIHLFQ